MAKEESKKVTVGSSETAPPPEPTKDVAEEKVVIPPPSEEKPDDSKALAVVEKVADVLAEKSMGGSTERDAQLARVETEKRMSLIKAWEENEKAKAENKAAKKMSSITAWENSKKASMEADLKAKEMELMRNEEPKEPETEENTGCSNMFLDSIRNGFKSKWQLCQSEEALEKKKAEYAEKMKNKVAMLHKVAEEKRAFVEANRGEEILKAEEMAVKYRATGLAPKKLFGCFGA